ncbi:MAG: glycoside hydrolase family 3 C-terminal domain-containing protein [Oscillospiraceae bacterium]|nr:glycoside hydrolase family 3 C-terminal domain-containing protein [Oscillospiraceae bacterium]
MKYTIEKREDHTLVRNAGGAVLGMGTLRLKEQDGLAFKNLSGEKDLLPYEDWRLPCEARAKDLAKRLSLEQIAGLMLWSPHQLVPFVPGLPFKGHYDGGDFIPGVTDPADLTDEQKIFVSEENLRNFLLVTTESARTAARWNNRLQSLAENSPLGVPVCISSDPRHAAGKKGAEFSGTGKEVSRWPEGLGMAATFDAELMKEFAKVIAKEYRALGITQALGPQIDLATDPRWMRLEDTMGADADMVTAFARAYCDGLQTTEGAKNGWGRDSVAAMVKHWPGGGTGEGGRDAHYAYGKFAVYPGGRFEEHMRPFTEGAFCLEDGTGKAAAVMPYYTVSWDQDRKYGENVGNSYSKYIIEDLLRGKEAYDGVVCTDWGITDDPLSPIDGFGTRAHGVEHLTEAERYWKILSNGVDMFGGCSRKEPVLQACRLGCEAWGEEAMRRRMEQSAERILTLMFRVGLFENPYLEPEESEKIVGAPEFVQAGLEAQRRSVVLLKNKENVLPLKKGSRIYVPGRHLDAHYTFFRSIAPAMDVQPLDQKDVQGWFTLTDTPEEADAAVVFAESPLCDCYSREDAEKGGNGYLPITLQYRPYTAEAAREHSVARGDFREGDCDRSYRGKTNTAYNASDLDNILNARAAMGDKPVIVVMQVHNPAVVAEFEAAADGILAHFGVENAVLMQILSGEAKAGGRLPLLLPANMETVERHCEDIAADMEAYVDECGNRYGYGFGLV